MALVAAGAAGLAAVTAPGVAYAALVPPLVLMGAGSGLFFAPFAAAVLGAVAPHEQGGRPAVSTTVREVGAVLGVACSARSSPRTATSTRPPGPCGRRRRRCGLAAVAAGGAACWSRSPCPLAPVPAHRQETPPMIAPLSSGPPGPQTTPRSARCSSVAYTPYAAELDPAVWDAYRADLLDLDRHARDGALSSPSSTGRIVGYVAFYPDATDQGLGWPAGWASGRATGGAPVPPRPRRRRCAAPGAGAAHPRVGRAGLRLPHLPVHGHRTGALPADGLRAGPGFDRDMNAHFGAPRRRPALAALAYLKPMDGLSGRRRRRGVTPCDARLIRGQDGRRRSGPGAAGIAGDPVAPGGAGPPRQEARRCRGSTSETASSGATPRSPTWRSFVDAVEAAPAALLLEGEPGIGKTTVWRSAQAAAVDRGHRVLAATAVEGEADLPFVALRDLLDDVAPDAAPALPPPQRAALDVALLRSADPRAVADQHAVCVAALGIDPHAGGASGRCVIAVDDVGWLDRSSDRVLRYVVRRLATEPVGVLATRRPADRRPRSGSTGRRWTPGCTASRSARSDRDAIHTLLTGRCGLQLPRRLTRRIHAACGGQPVLRGGDRADAAGPRGADRRRGRAAAAGRRRCGSPPSASRR